MSELGMLKTERKSGEEPFLSKGSPLPEKLQDFWQWSSSELVGNALRGLIAEYIVTMATGDPATVRQEWDAFDVKTPEGIRVEVKSSAYIQSWEQKKHSSIKFGIRPTLAWDSDKHTRHLEKHRQSDVYVFCLLQHKDQETINPLNLDQWQFYVVATSRIDDRLGAQKSLSLGKLLDLDPIKVDYWGLSDAVRRSL